MSDRGQDAPGGWGEVPRGSGMSGPGWSGEPAHGADGGPPPVGGGGPPRGGDGAPPGGGYGPQPGSGYGPQPGTGYGPQPGSGYGPQPGTGYGPQPGTGYGPQPGSGYGQFGAGGGQQVPTGPALQPGTIPLRPLNLGEIYDGAFRSIRANLPVMLGLSAIVVLLLGAIQAVATYSTYEQVNQLLGGVDPEADPEAFVSDFSDMATSLLLDLGVSSLVSFIAITVLTGLLIHAVSQAVIGRKAEFGDVWQAVRPQILRILLLSIVFTLLILSVVAVGVAVMLAAASTGSIALILLGLFFGAIGMLAGVITVLTLTVLATPALVLERSTIGAALRRGFDLARTSFWRVLGIYLLTTVLTVVLSFAITWPFEQVAMLSGGEGMLAFSIATLGGVVANWIVTPVLAAVFALLYIDVRIRTEGLDVELARAAQDG